MSLKTDVLFLQKDRFELYSSTILRVFEFLFVPEIVQDFDIKNSDLFKNLINVFIANNKIPPSELIIVLSDNACFVKDFIHPVQAQVAPDENMQKEIDLFVQHVPFDEVSYVTLPLTNGVKVFATNEGLYKDIISAFEKSGFKIDFVLPGIPFGNNLSTKTVMDPAMANFILQNSASVKSNNFLIHKPPQTKIKLTLENEVEANDAPEVEEEKPEGKNNKRILILVGVFIVLLIVLIIVYISSI